MYIATNSGLTTSFAQYEYICEITSAYLEVEKKICTTLIHHLQY